MQPRPRWCSVTLRGIAVVVAAIVLALTCDAVIRALAAPGKEPFSWQLGRVWGGRTKACLGESTLAGMEFHARGVDRIEFRCEGNPSPAEWYADITTSVAFPLGAHHPGLLNVFLPRGRPSDGFQYERSAFGLPLRATTREKACFYESGVHEGFHLSNLSLGLVSFQSGANGRQATAHSVWLPGAAANVAFWIVAIALPWLAAVRCRMLIRQHRCQCIDCGYALSGLAPGSPCPECGRRMRAKVLGSSASPCAQSRAR